MTRLIAVSLMAAPMLSGCLPLEQAPLVYTSRIQMGVGVAAGQPESPGLDVNIGFKGLDAALVPVAYAKHCGAKADKGCNAVKYDVQVVHGSNKLSAASLLDEQTTQRLLDTIATGNNAIKANSEQRADLERELREVGTLKEKESLLAALTPPPPTPTTDHAGAAITPAAAPLTAEQNAQAVKLKAEIDRLRDIKPGETQAKIDRLNKQNEDTAKSVAANEADLRKLLARRSTKSGDDKEDALSVYGSFNGSATGDRNGAGLTLGKVFSTGIAAQFIAQGLAASAPASAVAQCLRSAHDLLGKVTNATAAEREALLTSCKPAEKQ